MAQRLDRACAYEPCGRVARMLEQQRYCSKSCANRSRRGEKHKNKVGYDWLHALVTRERGKADRCIVFQCSTGCTFFEWANISHEYKDIGDFMPMCRTHHKQYDKPETAHRGASNGNAKLNRAKVLAIRERYDAGGISQQALADEYHVTKTNVRYIVQRKSWAWLESEVV
jgi:hypothetical protein